MFVEEWVNCWNHCCPNDAVSHDALCTCYECSLFINTGEAFLLSFFLYLSTWSWAQRGPSPSSFLLQPCPQSPLHSLQSSAGSAAEGQPGRSPESKRNKWFQPSNSSEIPLHNGILLEPFYCGTQPVIASVRLPSTWGSTNQPLKSNCRVARSQRKIILLPEWMELNTLACSAILTPYKQLCFGIKNK